MIIDDYYLFIIKKRTFESGTIATIKQLT